MRNLWNLLLSSFLDLRFGGHFLSCARNTVTAGIFLLLPRFWLRVFGDGHELVWILIIEQFWEQWRKHCNFSKISEKGGKQRWAFAVYIWFMLGIWFKKKTKHILSHLWEGKSENMFSRWCLELWNEDAPAAVRVLNGLISVFTDGIAHIGPSLAPL